jgi:hypothetical protein
VSNQTVSNWTGVELDCIELDCVESDWSRIRLYRIRLCRIGLVSNQTGVESNWCRIKTGVESRLACSISIASVRPRNVLLHDKALGYALIIARVKPTISDLLFQDNNSSEEYRAKRERNNEAVRKCRQLKREKEQQQEEEKESLAAYNKQLKEILQQEEKKFARLNDVRDREVAKLYHKGRYGSKSAQ